MCLDDDSDSESDAAAEMLNVGRMNRNLTSFQVHSGFDAASKNLLGHGKLFSGDYIGPTR